MSTQISFGTEERRLSASAAKRMRAVAICLFVLSALLLVALGLTWLWTRWPPKAVIIILLEGTAVVTVGWVTHRTASSFDNLSNEPSEAALQISLQRLSSLYRLLFAVILTPLVLLVLTSVYQLFSGPPR
ncbi:MAG: hypothetical protein JWN44_4565 [Myxococcales bacterium]|nr:hypothetical protein [Myxococcales bacterium]